MTEKETFTDFEIEQIECKKALDYSLSQIRLVIKIVLCTSFSMILIALIYGILNGLGVV